MLPVARRGRIAVAHATVEEAVGPLGTVDVAAWGRGTHWGFTMRQWLGRRALPFGCRGDSRGRWGVTLNGGVPWRRVGYRGSGGGSEGPEMTK